MAKKKTTKKKYNLKRPPVVTMLGHVDHGKTSILDKIRGTKVQVGEAGGITQNVRAHQIEYKTKSGEEYKITFIDTPGHEAFSEMRSRGATVTDIVVLVVAVNDSVQPQTKEAIKYAQKAKVPIVVALNKVDLKGVNKSKVLRELSDQKVQVEKLGGDVIYIETSAKAGTGLDELLEAILLTAEINDLKTKKSKKGIAEAVVLESTTDKSLGAISLCLVKAGEIKVGTFLEQEGGCTKIRAIKDENFTSKESASESEPVWLTGFNEEVPIGETLYFYNDPKDIETKEVKCEPEVESEVETKVKTEGEEGEEEETLDEAILAQLLENNTDNEKPTLPIILKTDSQGTQEVVEKELNKLSTDDSEIRIVDANTGDISEDDIMKAKTTGGIVIGFKSKISKKNEKIARIEKVLVRNYEIIYELLEEVVDVLEGMKEPVEVEVEVARAKIKKVFELSNGLKVAGCKVTKGTIVKGYRCYVERPSLKKENRIGEGKIVSLKSKKDEVKEATKGAECGIIIEPQVEIEKDDEVVCFKIEKN
jgi:translation initiation factor IF-2